MALYNVLISKSLVKPLRKKYDLFALKTKFLARVDGRIILRWIFKEVGWKGMDWIDLAQNRDSWRAVVNAVMSLRVAQSAGILLTAENRVASLLHGVSPYRAVNILSLL